MAALSSNCLSSWALAMAILSLLAAANYTVADSAAAAGETGFAAAS